MPDFVTWLRVLRAPEIQLLRGRKSASDLTEVEKLRHLAPAVELTEAESEMTLASLAVLHPAPEVAETL